MNKIAFGLLLAVMNLAGWVQAADQTAHAEHGAPPSLQDREKMWKAMLAKPSLAVSAAFDEKGGLWRASVRDGYVSVDFSGDNGKSWGQPVKVNAEAENIAADGENRPKILVRKEVVYISYTQALEKPMTGDIRFSRSLDGGKTFSAPLTVNDNREIISHRFEALEVNDRGQVFLAWLDKRDLSAAIRKGEKYTGVGVYYAVSDDGGANFHSNAKAADHSCECCRVAMALDADGTPVVFWRHVYGKNERDHAMLRLDGKSSPIRVSYDRWEVDACPHHGGALSVASDGVHHFVWFDNAPERHGLFYANSTDRGKTFSTPLNFGNFEAQAGHPYVLSVGKSVHIVWKEFDGQNSVIRGMSSADGGKSWSPPRQIAATTGASDHPLLIADGTQPYLSWNTAKEGFRLIGMEL
ncbi:hypothetical protein SCT_2100 [Sulfuricella sp. T08]|uniref:sialidase family protein n=1 Tax=Sulfuricella sp. T08 TaxID=1632857 RepID=UPI0006179FC4|nr:sialidase family protein [Sulfuricella sp. T08]GAO36690.1 hypothetical protein SCT_2100 [Sulfuricella sp. T08]